MYRIFLLSVFMSEAKMIVVTGTNKFQLLWDSPQRELCERLTFDQKGHHTTHIIAESTIFRRCSYDSLYIFLHHWPKKVFIDPKSLFWQVEKNPLLGAAICGEWALRPDAPIAQTCIIWHKYTSLSLSLFHFHFVWFNFSFLACLNPNLF